ncbi:MAG TPA: hypothetical protein VFM14_07675 [Gemmatimonadales bacterium]|nr:hypothetical protein [Gemmatimonadales bacterium]
MSLLSALTLAAAICPESAATAVCPPARQDPPPVSVTVDSSRHEVTLTTGPWTLPNMPPMEDHAMMEGAAGSQDSPIQHFEWPVDGWFRGFRYEIVDAKGNVLDRRLMHHMIVVNFDRRQLLYSAVERIAGAGSETDDASVPKTIGVPMSKGMDLGFYIMWHNESGKDLDGVYLRYTMLWTPTNQNPRPVTSLPLYMDVNLTVGGSNTFDVPPGRSEKAHEFTLPMGGRLLGVGGHLHDYGTMVKLLDAESGKELTRVTARRDSTGKVLAVSRKLFGVSGEGLKLKPNHRYRVVGVYDNPTDQLRVDGAMAHMVGLFVPDDMSKWPAVDTSDAVMRRDLASLKVPGYEDVAAPVQTGEHGHHGASAGAAGSGHGSHSGAKRADEEHADHNQPRE